MIDYLCDPKKLEAFVAGQLDEEENEQVLSHLAECGRCLSLVDKLWAEQYSGHLSGQVPELDLETAMQVERSLNRRIQQTNLLGQLSQIALQGLVKSWAALVVPFIRKKKSASLIIRR